MPTKTNFIGLDKLQDNEYYSSDIENANLDKIDEQFKICDKRTSKLEDKITKKENLKVGFDSINRSMAISNSVGGLCDFEIRGKLVENLLGDKGSFNQIFSTSVQQGEYSLDAKQKPFGKFSMKIKKIDSGMNFVEKVEEILPDLNQYYLVSIYTKRGTLSGVTQLHKHANGGGKLIVADAITSNEWTRSGIKLKPSDIKKGDTIGVATYATNNGEYCHVAGYMINKISKNEYDHLTSEELLDKYPYTEGIVPIRGATIEANHENLIDICKPDTETDYVQVNHHDNSVKAYSNRHYRVGTTYCIKVSNGYYNISGNRIGCYNGANSHYLVVKNEYGRILTTVSNGKLGKFSLDVNVENFRELIIELSRFGGENDKTGYATYSDIMVTKGKGKKLFTEYEQSFVNFDDPLIELPNGFNDKIFRINNETFKIANTNVGRDEKFTNIDRSKWTINRAPSGADDVYFNYKDELIDVAEQTGNIDGSIYIEGFSEQTGGTHRSFYTYNNLCVLQFKKGLSDDALYEIVENLNIAYQLSRPIEIQLKDKCIPLISYDGKTTFNLSNGLIKGEKASFALKDNGDRYYFNITDDHPYTSGKGSMFKYKVEKINDIYTKLENTNESIKCFCDIESSYAYGYLRFSISKAVVDKNEIDISNIYVDYQTVETNGKIDVDIKYNSDLSSVLSDHSETIYQIAKKVDEQNDLLYEPIRWFEPTLLNNAVLYDKNKPIRISRLKNRIFIEGRIRGDGDLVNGSVIFESSLFKNNNLDDLMYVAPSSEFASEYRIYIRRDGKVYIYFSDKNASWVNLKRSIDVV
jgi:hypothetical protein